MDRLERFYKIDQLLKERKLASFAMFINGDGPYFLVRGYVMQEATVTICEPR